MRLRAYEPQDRERVIEMQKAQMMKWFGEVTPAQIMDPADPLSALTIVAEDDDGRIFCTVGAKRTVEIIVTMDPSGWSMPDYFRKVMIPLWAKMIYRIHVLGYEDASAKLGPHLKKWGNSLVKRFGFYREPFEVFRFDIKKACQK